MSRTQLAAVLIVPALLLGGCSSSNQAPAATAGDSGGASAVGSATASSSAEMVSKAVAAVKAELPDIPVWKGTTFTGAVVDATTVCVDRTYPPGGGIDGKGGSAGYVMVSFPEVKPGEPQDGTCKEAKPSASASSAAPVAVPDAMKDRAGLVTRDDLGDEWPLTVDYGVLACVPKEAGGYNLKLASFEAPNGTRYALNGQAKSHLGLPAIDPIWAQNPTASGLKKNISPLLDRALGMC